MKTDLFKCFYCREDRGNTQVSMAEWFKRSTVNAEYVGSIPSRHARQ